MLDLLATAIIWSLKGILLLILACHDIFLQMRSSINQKLIETGESDKLKEILRTRWVLFLVATGKNV